LAWALAPDRVVEVSEGLKAEAAAVRAPATEAANDADPTRFYFAAIEAVTAFYSAAARQGQAIVGGVS
jgi:hypothetical protein